MGKRWEQGAPVRIDGSCSDAAGESFRGERGRVVDVDNPTGVGADGQRKVLIQTERGVVAVPEKAVRRQ